MLLIGIFLYSALKNGDSATVAFLDWTLHLPLGALICLVFAAGAAAGILLTHPLHRFFGRRFTH